MARSDRYQQWVKSRVFCGLWRLWVMQHQVAEEFELKIEYGINAAKKKGTRNKTTKIASALSLMRLGLVLHIY